MNTKLAGTKKNTKRTTQSVTKYSDAVQTIQKIDEKLEEVRKVYNTSFRTNGDSKVIHVNPSNVNVRLVVDIRILLAILGEITTKCVQYDNAAKVLGLVQYPSFIWQGYTLDAWLYDIKLRIAQIEQSATETELLAIRNELREFITKEDKISMLQERMTKLGI